MNKYKTTIFLPNEFATLTFGTQLAHACPHQCLIFLYGDLGAGKTTLVRGFLQGLGHMDKVKSPTYTLVEQYELKDYLVFHFDLYRLNEPNELNEMGIQDYFIEPAVHLIEWPERGNNVLPPPDLTCYIRMSEGGREITLTSNSACGNQIFQQLETS